MGGSKETLAGGKLYDKICNLRKVYRNSQVTTEATPHSHEDSADEKLLKELKETSLDDRDAIK